jgi:hypothetical protein
MGRMGRIARRSRTAKTETVRAADVVGVPMMPPAAATLGVERLRALVGAAHRALVPPPVRILDAMLAPLDTAVLGAICTLGLPDEVRGGVDLRSLAARVDIDPDRLERLVRYAHSRGWLRLDRRGRVHATRVTRFLSRQHPGGWSGWVDFAGDADVLGALAALGRDPRAVDPFAAANGSAFFDWCSAHPERQAAFDAAMAAGARMHALALADALDWSGTRRVCDVGGGTGELLRVLVGAHPELHGVVVEIPTVAVRVVPTDRITVRPADAFEFAEPDCDRYLFVNVVHDWSDDDAVRLLARVRRVAPDNAEVVVVEGERRARPTAGIALSTDLLMLALTPGGRERTTAEIAALAMRAGWSHQRRIALPSGDYAHILTSPPVNRARE